tara:strand:+ start:184 stop:624 length:441 start_codon:yes stop_codon:yes gene_type:complete
MTLKLLKAKESDSPFFYKLRNDKINRKNSVSTKKIRLDNHNDWFLKAIKKASNFIYIIKINKINCGYLRYEKKRNYLNVSICIDKKFRNRNIALSALLIGDKRVKSYKNLKLKAVVKKNNFPSIQLFLKASYVIFKKEKNLIIFRK